MKKTFLLLTLCAGMGYQATAQSKNSSNTVDYTPNYDLPHEFAKLSVHMQPLNILAGTGNIAIGAGLQAVYRPTENILIDAFGTMAYADRFSEDKTPYGDGLVGFKGQVAFSTTGTRSASELGATGVYYFRMFEDDKFAYLHLKSSGNVNTIAKVPCKAVIGLGVRLGLWRTNSFYQNDGVNFNGTLADQTPTPISSPAPATITIPGGYASSMFSQTLVRIGFEHLIQENTSGHFPDYPTRKGNMDRNTRYTKRIYGDLLFAATQNLGNVLIPTMQNVDPSNGTTSWTNFREYNVNSNTAKSKIGILAGYSFLSTDGFSFNYGVEAGLMPGPGSITTNIFFNLKVNFSISSNKPPKP
jgi:hypothetical protein